MSNSINNKTIDNPATGWLLSRVTRLWRSAISQTVNPMGMTEARWSVMMNIKTLGEGTSQSMLANELGIEMPSLNRTVNQLVKLDLVDRRPHPSDRRCQCLWFTDSGKKCIQSLSDSVALVRNELTRDVSDSELTMLITVLKKIEHNACVMLNKHNEGDK
jgi:MarR family transcriptional regulator for hemolysin